MSRIIKIDGCYDCIHYGYVLRFESDSRGERYAVGDCDKLLKKIVVKEENLGTFIPEDCPLEKGE
jgi:hypothetical protein